MLESRPKLPNHTDQEQSSPTPDSKEFSEDDFNTAFEKQKNAKSSTSVDAIDSSGYSSASTFYTATKERTVVSGFYFPSYEDNSPTMLYQKRGLNPEHESRIKRNFRYLKEELDVDCGLLDHFIQENIFTNDQVESIISAGSRRRKSDCLLRMLLRCKENAYAQFMDFLTATKCGHIREVLESETKQKRLDFGTCTVLDSFKALNAIVTHKAEIIDQLEPDNIVDFFIQYEEFTIDEYECIISQLTRRNKAEKLMEILTTGNHMPQGYHILLKALNDTEEQYLLQLLSLNNENKPDDNEVLIKTTIIAKIKNWNDGKRQKKQTEEYVVDAVNMDNVEFEINDVLFSDTRCLIKSVDKGSIIIRVKGCGHGSLKQLMDSGYKKGLERVLKVIYSHPKVHKYVGRDAILVTDVEYLQTVNEDKIKEKKFSCKEIVSTNRAFLVEELDPIIFMQLDMFTKGEAEAVRIERVSSRAKATRRMIEIVLAKTEDEVRKFMTEIKLRKEFVWKHICPKEFQDDSEEALISGYEILVENICPSLISDYCIEKGLLPNYMQFVSTARPRSVRAKFILQEIMKKGHVERNVFWSIVSTFEDCLDTCLSEKKGREMTSPQVQEEHGEEIGLQTMTIYPFPILKAHDASISLEIGNFKKSTQIDQKQGHEDHRPKYKTEINIIGEATYVSTSVVVQETECEDGDKCVKNENDTESGYESLSLNRRTEMLERFSMPV
ncbi:uncharacterized protein LOC128557673 isoform X2 [Mercenaria mercenaria]|uniref:uncharacterized protein LOC128557673 isoform X2 n=1 Tax=Mercenaria mercenaria TaxID=6596 RepID=UPI00234EACF1|nr:uncharacterized protein LOC128557673 isoform X2 [Mercenaria mercenaria]